jgi:hypothetical protein
VVAVALVEEPVVDPLDDVEDGDVGVVADPDDEDETDAGGGIVEPW